jgi:hypothetical protein
VIAREEGEMELLRASGSEGSLRWRGRHEAVCVSLDVANPLALPLQVVPEHC